MASSPSSHLTTSIRSLTDMIKYVQFKLDQNNYHIWRALISPILKANRVFNHVDPNHPIPPTQTLDPSTNNLIPNPDYEQWVRIDHLVLSCIYATVTEPILTQLIGFESAREVWNYLETSNFTQNTARVPELRRQLETLQKGNLTIDEYLSKRIVITNILDFVGESLSDRDSIISTFRGLGLEYENFVKEIMARPNLPDYFELRRLLIDEEIDLNFPQ